MKARNCSVGFRAHAFDVVAQAVADVWQIIKATWSAVLGDDTGSYPASVALEGLEGRRLLSSTSFSNGALGLEGNGAGASNAIYVTLSADGTRVWGIVNNMGRMAYTSQLAEVDVTGISSTDNVSVDPRLTIPVKVNGSTPTPPPTNPTPPPTDPTPTPVTNPAPDPTPTAPTPTPTNPTPPSQPVSGAPSPQAVIHMVSDTSVLAGQAIQAHPLDSVLNVGTDLTAHYDWDFGDPNGRYNQMTGFEGSHVYDAPGTYTVTLRVTNEAGGVSTATQQVTISPDNRRSVFVDSVSGNDSSDGSSPDNPIRSIWRANQLISDNTRVLFHRGETFSTDQRLNFEDHFNIMGGAYGDTSLPKPIIQWTAAVNSTYPNIVTTSHNSNRIAIQDLTFDLAPSAMAGDDLHYAGAFIAAGKNLLVRNCTFLNVGDAVNANASPAGLVVMDNNEPLFKGMRGYFVWMQGWDISVIGNTVPNSTRQHIVRGVGWDRVEIAYNDFTNAWDPNDSQDIGKTTVNLQPGNTAYVVGNKLTTGWIQVGPLPMFEGHTDNVVIEGNTVNNTTIGLQSGASNVMIRNNVIHADLTTSIQMTGWDYNYNRGVTDVSVLNNTMINNDRHGQFMNVEGLTQNVTVDNNLMVGPSFAPGEWNETAAMYVQYKDLSGFKEIRNNVWPSSSYVTTFNKGGTNYLGAWSYGNNGFQSRTDWDNQPVVSNDSWETVTLDNRFAPNSNSAAATWGRPVAGVLGDMYGNGRPSSGLWSVGAVQP